MTRRLAREEGIFAGISSGGAMHVALRIAKELKNAVIVTIICDRGDRYLTTGCSLTKKNRGQTTITAGWIGIDADATPSTSRPSPDVRRHPQAHDLPEDLPDRDVAEIAAQKRRVQTASDFLPPYLHRVVVISCVLRDDDGVRVFSIGEPEANEAAAIQPLLRRHRQVRAADRVVERARLRPAGAGQPRRSSTAWRGLLLGQRARDQDFRYNNYINRFHDRHCDLMDVLSLYGGRGSPLDEVARLAGFPGKLGIGGRARCGRATAAARSPRSATTARRIASTPTSSTCASSSCAAPRRGALRSEECALVRSTLEKRPSRTGGNSSRSGRADPRHRLARRRRARRRAQRRRQGGVRRRRASRRARRFQVLSPESASSMSRAPPRSSKRSAGRREPRCPHFGVCGGCATQHADERTQMAAKQRWLEDNLERIGKVRPRPCCRSSTARNGATAAARGSRCAACRRAAARWSASASGARATSPTCASATCCRRSVRADPPLRSLVEKLSIRARVPQIEVAVGDNATVLVFRHLEPLTDEDAAILRASRENHGVHLWLQPGGPGSAHPFHPATSELYYELPEFGVRIGFRPTDFTQVNHEVNRVLVARGAAARPATGRARRRPLLRARQFLAAARDARRRGGRLRGQAASWSSARAQRRRERPRGAIRGHGPVQDRHRSLRALREDPARPAARGRDRARQGAAGAGRGASSTCRATRRRSRATPACWFTPRASASRRRAW